jgi:simple sugar transport system substrate-binding protein
MTLHSLSRRSLLKVGAAGLAATALPFGIAKAQTNVILGIVYVGPKDDFGWNQAHAVGAAALKALPDVTVVEEENVPETDAVAKSMESMINLDGAKLLFPTSFGYFDPFMVDMSKKYPDVEFRHPTSLWNKDKHPMNLGGYFCYLDQAHYINGVAAGLATKTNKLGFIAAKPIALVLRNVNAFLMGVKKVNPAAEVRLIITGEWSLPVREAEATNALVDAGCDVIACHVDSPKVVVETAEGARHQDLRSQCQTRRRWRPRASSPGLSYKWETIYKSYADDIAAGKVPPNFLVGGYNNDMLRNTAYGAGATPEAIKAADAAIEALKGGAPIYKGTLKDNTGKVVVDKEYDNYDPYLDGMNWLLEGVQGSIT